MTTPIMQLFESLIQRINQTVEYREFVRNWVGPYQGKVLQLETDKGTFHIRIHQQGTMTLHMGMYPSPDVIYKSSVETLLNLFTGQASFRELMKSWELVIIGAGHESVPLGQLIARVLQSS
ncbi:MAG: SCP2 sterol-binding domain-containing protein [Candidatus Hodarchaeota archaeon]